MGGRKGRKIVLSWCHWQDVPHLTWCNWKQLKRSSYHRAAVFWIASQACSLTHIHPHPSIYTVWMKADHQFPQKINKHTTSSSPVHHLRPWNGFPIANDPCLLLLPLRCVSSINTHDLMGCRRSTHSSKDWFFFFCSFEKLLLHEQNPDFV